jgi:hypothetical protein
MPFFANFMHPEEIFNELELLVDRLPFNLPYHEDGGVVYPFAWNSSVQGEFNIFNLFRANDWIEVTDTDSVIKQWKGLKYARAFRDLSLRKPEVKAWQDGVETLAQEIGKLTNLQAYDFRLKGDYISPSGIIIAQNNQGDWIGITSTVYVESGIPKEVVDLSPLDLPKLEAEQNNSDIAVDSGQKKIISLMPKAPKPKHSKNTKCNDYLDGCNTSPQIVTIISKLKGIELSGDFGSDYSYSYTYKMEIGMGKTHEVALQNTLKASGMLTINKFNTIYKNRDDFPDYYCDDSEEEVKDIFDRYAKITELLKQELVTPLVYRISSCIRENIYIIGEANESEKGDKLGIYIKSSFVYNP